MNVSRKISSSLVFTLLLAVAALAGSGKRFADPTIAKAYELFVPIACTSADGRFTIGTGFPIAANEVMTAKHVHCDEDEVTEISNDQGQTWQVIPLEDQHPDPHWDMQRFTVAGAHYRHPAKFREALIGEEVAGYGIAFNETATLGFVMKSEGDELFASNTAIGGMSGSALVARDGKVVGMVIEYAATIVGRKTPSSYVSRAIPGLVLKALAGGVS